ncbi:MAG: hypothetical protein HYU87_04270 [Chloroflexi bacterium]|nr:hypothetical protein [Chloroflexota bacterium]
MAEYDLVCDVCREALSAADALISWTTEGQLERGFALTHTAHVPAGATDRFDGRMVTSPNGYLRFVSERLGHRVDDPEPLRAILWALAPYVVRPDNPAEMDAMRAASFGARLGVKPGTQPSALAAGAQEKHEAGK